MNEPLRAGRYRGRHPHYRSKIAVGAVLALACLSVAAWVFSYGARPSSLGSIEQMKPNAAIGFALLAIAWFVPVTLGRAAALVVIVIATLTLVEHVLGSGRGFDEAIFPDPGSGHGRMAALTAVGLLVLGACLLAPTSSKLARRTIEWACLAIGALGATAALGYLYEANPLYNAGPLSGISLPAALAIVVLAFATSSTVGDGFLQWFTHGHDAGARLMRRLAPTALLVVPAVGFAPVLGQRFGWYDSSVAAAMSTVATVTVVVIALVYSATDLRRSDRDRKAASAALEVANHDLERRVQDRAAQLEAERGINAVLVDRERIAADMHDIVIQRLYAIAIDLQIKGKRAGPSIDLDGAIDGLDDAIGDLRRSIFDLKNAPGDHDVLAAVDQIVLGAASAIGTPPTLRVEGDITELPAIVATHLVASLREAVSNVVRHAEARQLEITIDVAGSGVTLTVTDDGRGIDPAVVSSSGLRNIRHRAAQLGGWCIWQPGVGGGTSLVWHASFAGQTAEPGPGLDTHTMAIRIIESVRELALVDPAAPVDEHLHLAGTALRSLLGADCFSVLRSEDSDATLLRIVSTDGFDAAFDPVGSTIPRASSVPGQVARFGSPIRVNAISELPAQQRHFTKLNYGAVLVAPVAGAHTMHGLLSFARVLGRPPFGQDEEDAAMILAAHVGALLDLRPPADGRIWRRSAQIVAPGDQEPTAGDDRINEHDQRGAPVPLKSAAYLE